MRRLELRLHKLNDATVDRYAVIAIDILPPTQPNDQDRLLGACASRWHLALANLDPDWAWVRT